LQRWNEGARQSEATAPSGWSQRGKTVASNQSDLARRGNVVSSDQSRSSHGGNVVSSDQSRSSHGGNVVSSDQSRSSHGGNVVSFDHSGLSQRENSTPSWASASSSMQVQRGANASDGFLSRGYTFYVPLCYHGYLLHRSSANID
jgi:hypothetical protein